MDFNKQTRPSIKITLIVAFTIMSFNITIGQNFNFDEEMKRNVSVPNTPEAEAFAKYGNTPVDMYTGKPNISIPLYTISGKELSLPITLDYDASGVKEIQLATGAGLNWNLNAGGRISRVVNGLVDDYIYASNTAYQSVFSSTQVCLPSPSGCTGKTVKQLILENLNPPQNFSSQQDAIEYFAFLRQIGENKIDTQPDYFSFNAVFISTHFVYDMDTSTFVSLDNPRIKASVVWSASNTYIETWTVTNADGSKFYFNLAEKTKAISPDIVSTNNIIQDYYSSWVLTRIESPNLTDVYDFEYNNLTHLTDEICLSCPGPVLYIGPSPFGKDPNGIEPILRWDRLPYSGLV